MTLPPTHRQGRRPAAAAVRASGAARAFVVACALALAAPACRAAETVTVSTIQELADAAARSGVAVKMKPGVYQMTDLLTPEAIAAKHEAAKEEAKRRDAKRPTVSMITFAGSDSTFDLTGVTIEVDTKLLSAFKGATIQEFTVDGKNVTIDGLTVRDLGNEPTATGGQSFVVNGDQVTVKNVTLHISGSFPYGYGDLLGKGDRSVVRQQKHSGLLVSGTDTKVIGCKIFTRSFGHAFFVQGGVNTLFQDCYAEGQMRKTDDMLAETSGVAFENGFKTVYKPNVIQPNYMKSLSECGFRTYGQGGLTARKTGKVTVVNCTAKGMRVGFALGVPDAEASSLKDCVAIECERGYTLDNAVVERSRGDAKYGPLLYLTGDEGKRSTVDLTLTPEVSDITVHALATISGEGHDVTLRSESPRSKPAPILIGYTPPSAGENSAPIGEGAATGIKLTNLTGMPIVFGPKATANNVTTNGKVESDAGESNRVARAADKSTSDRAGTP